MRQSVPSNIVEVAWVVGFDLSAGIRVQVSNGKFKHVNIILGIVKTKTLWVF